MRIVLDTNVIVSGIFFGGPPGAILDAWRDAKFVVVMSPAIFEEVTRVTGELAIQFPKVDPTPLLEHIARAVEFFEIQAFDQQVCADADDDKFLESALAGNAPMIVSGDKHLLQVSGFANIEVIRPREFVDRFLTI